MLVNIPHLDGDIVSIDFPEQGGTFTHLIEYFFGNLAHVVPPVIRTPAVSKEKPMDGASLTAGLTCAMSIPNA